MNMTNTYRSIDKLNARFPSFGGGEAVLEGYLSIYCLRQTERFLFCVKVNARLFINCRAFALPIDPRKQEKSLPAIILEIQFASC